MQAKFKLFLPRGKRMLYRGSFIDRVEALKVAEKLLKSNSMVLIVRNKLVERLQKNPEFFHFSGTKIYKSIDEMKKEGLNLISDMITPLDYSDLTVVKVPYRPIAVPIIENENMLRCFESISGVHLNRFWYDKPIFISIPKCGTLSIDIYWVYYRREVCSIGHIAARFFPPEFRKNMFTIVRNPYDRLVSAYHFILKGGFNQNPIYLEIKEKYKSFEDWVLNGLSEKDTLPPVKTGNVCNAAMEVTMTQAYFLLDEDGELCLKKENIGRFENFKADVLRLTGLDIQKAFNQSDRSVWQKYYINDKVREKVERLYAKDFELLGYSHINRDLALFYSAMNPYSIEIDFLKSNHKSVIS